MPNILVEPNRFFSIYKKFIVKTFLIVNFAVGQGDYLKDFNLDSLKYKIIKAEKTNKSPNIDGLFDENIWSVTNQTTEFFQIEPKELFAPSEKTSVRVLFDDKALYVFLEAFDSSPDNIKKTLVRRDSWVDGFSNNSDWVGVKIDSKNDDYNGYFFAVNASGAKIDVALSGTDIYDTTWDVVWDVAVSFNEKGWTAEFELPFSIFQYDNKQGMEWGIEFLRGIHRLQETVSWPGKPKAVRGLVLPLGILKGLKDIPSKNQLEFSPYFLTGRNEKIKSDLGLDFRYGLTTNSVMKVTFNPDFGQVEADPSVVNLTAFETFYEEKRPFFTEGSEFFSQRINLFNSRRIGKVPNHFIPDERELLNIPDFTTILGATKIMGSTNSGVNYGIIGAVTTEEKATFLDSMITKKIIIEPKTNYSIGRFEFPIFNNTSRYGLMGTNVSRKDTTGATVIGADWDIGFFSNRLFSSGQIIRSVAENIPGNAYRFNLGYLDPLWWGARIWYGKYDNKFNINDLGYLKRNNITWSGLSLEFRKQEPSKNFINNNIELSYSNSRNGKGSILEKEIEIDQSNLLKNYWKISFGAGLDFPAFNDEDIYRDESAWTYKTELKGRAMVKFRTDRRKKVILGGGNGFGYGRKRGLGYRRKLELKIKPIESLNIEMEVVEDFSPNYMQYVDVIKSINDTTRVYAESKLLTRDLSLRLNWTFSPEMTLQCFIQPFFANMTYKSFSRLLNPNSMNLEPYSYLSNYENPNFKYSSTVGTFVFRFEYQPGSTIYLVYNLNQENLYSFTEKEWEITKRNAVYFKINYWLKY